MPCCAAPVQSEARWSAPRARPLRSARPSIEYAPIRQAPGRCRSRPAACGGGSGGPPGSCTPQPSARGRRRGASSTHVAAPGSVKRTVASPASSPVPPQLDVATPSRITGCPSSGAIPSSVGTVSRTLGRSSTPGSRFSPDRRARPASAPACRAASAARARSAPPTPRSRPSCGSAPAAPSTSSTCRPSRSRCGVILISSIWSASSEARISSSPSGRIGPRAPRSRARADHLRGRIAVSWKSCIA